MGSDDILKKAREVCRLLLDEDSFDQAAAFEEGVKSIENALRDAYQAGFEDGTDDAAYHYKMGPM